MEDIKKDIKDATFDYLVKNSTPDTNLLDDTDDTVKDIKELLQTHHYYR